MTDKVEQVALAVCAAQVDDETGGVGPQPVCNRSCVTCRNIARAAIAAHEEALREAGFVIVPKPEVAPKPARLPTHPSATYDHTCPHCGVHSGQRLDVDTLGSVEPCKACGKRIVAEVEERSPSTVHWYFRRIW